MGHSRSQLHHSPALTAFDQLQVSEASVDAVAHLREASSHSLARHTVGLPEDRREESFVAFLSVAHQHQIPRLLEPPLGRDHKLLDERLVPFTHNEADQKPTFGIDGGSFPPRVLLRTRIPPTLVHLYRGGFHLSHSFVVELP